MQNLAKYRSSRLILEESGDTKLTAVIEDVNTSVVAESFSKEEEAPDCSIYFATKNLRKVWTITLSVTAVHLDYIHLTSVSEWKILKSFRGAVPSYFVCPLRLCDLQPKGIARLQWHLNIQNQNNFKRYHSSVTWDKIIKNSANRFISQLPCQRRSLTRNCQQHLCRVTPSGYWDNTDCFCKGLSMMQYIIIFS